MGDPPTNPYDGYDYISGTMMLNPVEYLKGTEALEAGGQQTTFYTQRAFEILKRGLMR